MRIGILTFHSQLNYGGVLQAYALQEVLTLMGHKVFMIDRWINPFNARLLGPTTFKSKIKTWIKSFFFAGVYSRLKRHRDTTKFVRSKLNLTSYSFLQWHELNAKRLDFDVVIVGSDQVWNGTYNDPRPYLLIDAPEITAIAYAASFGMREIPTPLLDIYRQGFQRFKFISCRESEGVDLVRKTGFDAMHVVDPTLLLEPSIWRKLTRQTNERILVCYLLSEDVYATLPKVRAFARKQKCKVRIFVDKLPPPFPKTKEKLKKWLLLNYYSFFTNVSICLSADPQAFLDAHASATWVITDSFHSVMFSSIFDRNVRVLRPTVELRKAMFARIEEFVQKYVEGPMVVNSMDEALESFEQDETIRVNQSSIEGLRQASKMWLENALKECEHKKKSWKT